MKNEIDLVRQVKKKKEYFHFSQKYFLFSQANLWYCWITIIIAL